MKRTVEEELARAAAFPLIYGGGDRARAMATQSLIDEAMEMVVSPSARKTVACGRRVSCGKKHRVTIERQRRAEICRVRICERLSVKLRRSLYGEDDET